MYTIKRLGDFDVSFPTHVEVEKRKATKVENDAVYIGEWLLEGSVKHGVGKLYLANGSFF